MPGTQVQATDPACPPHDRGRARQTMRSVIIINQQQDGISCRYDILEAAGWTYCTIQASGTTAYFLPETMRDVALAIPSCILPRMGGMATMPSRIDSLRTALPHILPQVDYLYLYFDKYDKVPREFSSHPKIISLLPDKKSRSLGCDGKLFGLRLNPDPCLFILFDDDIIYPGEYVSHMVAALQRHHYRSIVGLHGAIYKALPHSYVKDRQILHFSMRQDFDILVDELGTGTMAFHSGCIDINPDKWMHVNMTDLMVMIEAVRQKIPRISIRRTQDFLRPIAQNQPDSLYIQSLQNDRIQTNLLNQAMQCYPASWCISS